MMRLVFAAVFAAAGPSFLAAEPIPLPSGLQVEFLDIVADDPGLGYAYRFRFVAAALDASRSYSTTEADLAHLCRSYALPRVVNADPPAASIVIALADRVLPFGSTDPEAVQFFEAYTPLGADCVWQAF
ncbi:DUF6497 family protein [Palleronia sp.]|uniref:DUF6497 family protein n=1 Tax=Palleronia sp. TaxID=1940284 RepID=UPI0035C86D6B